MAAARVAAAALQYSKSLSKFISWVWALYRFAVLFASSLTPAAANALVSSIGTLDTIMMINVGTYLCNSLGEKWLYSDRFVLHAFNKGWFKALFNNLNTNNIDDTKNSNDESSEEENGGEEDDGDQNG